MNQTDYFYIKKVLGGDSSQFKWLIEKYSRDIHILILKIVRDSRDAEELTQDTFLKAFRCLPAFREDCLFSTWLYRIAYTTAISATRKKKREFLYIDEQTINKIEDHEINEVFEYAVDETQLQQLEDAIIKLFPEERAIVTLFYNEQRSIEEISNITGLTNSNAKVKLHRIRKKLYFLLSNNINTLNN